MDAIVAMAFATEQLIVFSECAGFQGVSEMSQFQNVERAIKQALYQLHRLSNIWTDVLPIAVYNRSMGEFTHLEASTLHHL